MRGKFITLEGGEGVGKSTQISALADALRARGHAVVVTREPGGSPGAEAIRELLLHQSADAWSPQTEALLFAAARSDHVARVICPTLERGEWVLCDRYIDSSRAYQGGAGGLSDDDIMALHRVGSGGLLPDRTLLLTVNSAATSSRRAARQLARPDRFEERQSMFHDRVNASFMAMAAQDPARFRIIDASGTPEQVTASLLSALDDLGSGLINSAN
ncbi:MAG: dTMP kinase [Pseudomonadota bacterium]